MGPNTVRVLATLCCALGLALVILGAMLCPRSLYANQGTAQLLPCHTACDNGCAAQTPPDCGPGNTSQYCDTNPTQCSQCRCKSDNNPINPVCECF